MTLEDDEITIAQLVNSVNTIEDELGVNPGGVYANVSVRLDILEARINNPLAPAPTVTNPFIIGNDGVTINTGTGAPSLGAVPGSLFLREDGYTNNLYSRGSDGYWHVVGSGGGSVSLIIPYSIVSGAQQVNVSTFTGIGAIVFDPSVVVGGGITSTELDMLVEGTAGVTAEIRLYNITDGVPISGTTLDTSANSPTELSVTLNVGTDIPNSKKIYEVQLRISAPGSPGVNDRAICKFAAFQVSTS